MRKYLGRAFLVLLALALTGIVTQDVSAQVSCSGVPAFASCTAYANGASVTYNNSKYTSIAPIPSNRDCPPNSPYNPSTDNWWVNNGTCSGATATATARPTATPTTARGTATATSRATATRTSTATATRTPTATATSSGPGCYVTWNSATAYVGGAQVSRVCGSITENFHAMFWTQGNDPCTNRSNGSNGEEWMSEGACGGSVTPTPTTGPTPTPGGSGIGSIVTSANFDAIWPPGIRSATYTYADFVTAGGSYPALCGTGDNLMQRRECAAYFGNKTQETGTGQYDRELYCQPGGGGYGTVACNYCDNASACASDGNSICAAGQQYWGRHAIQLSWNYNYCSGGAALGINLHADPNQIFTNKVTGWKASNWYWMTQLGPNVANWPLESAHAAMVTAGSAGNHFYGGTIRAINGGLECIQNDQRQLNRITYYANVRSILGAGPSVGRDTCYP